MRQTFTWLHDLLTGTLSKKPETSLLLANKLQGRSRYVVAITMEIRMDGPAFVPSPIPRPANLRRGLHFILHPLHMGPDPRCARVATSIP